MVFAINAYHLHTDNSIACMPIENILHPALTPNAQRTICECCNWTGVYSSAERDERSVHSGNLGSNQAMDPVLTFSNITLHGCILDSSVPVPVSPNASTSSHRCQVCLNGIMDRFNNRINTSIDNTYLHLGQILRSLKTLVPWLATLLDKWIVSYSPRMILPHDPKIPGFNTLVRVMATRCMLSAKSVLEV